jgi:predicted transcriptional regulator
MSSKAPYARIAITLPQDALDAADRRAKELDRPRSWVIAEAVREYVARAAGAAVKIETGMGSSRLAQLEADLRLTPQERVIAAEQTANSTPGRKRGRVQRVVAFDRFEDYLDFKRRDGIDW